MTKLLGKRNSLKWLILRILSIAIIVSVLLSVILFIRIIEASVQLNLIEITIRNREQIHEILVATRINTILSLLVTVFISIILTSLSLKKIIKPINELNEAIKKIATGDFDVQLTSDRVDEIGELTNNFNFMAKQLRVNEQFQQEFINNVSHEIKTPFSSIEGFAKLLAEEGLSKEEREDYAGIIVEESERVTNMATKMLKLSKLQNQTMITKKTKIRLSEQLRKCVAILEPKWREKNLLIDVQLEEETFWGDEDLMFQVWLNIIENAIKFSMPDSKIEIFLSGEEEKIVVKIKDYGIGMTEEEKSKIFDRFYQIDKSHSQNGAGLGLSIVKRIIELSNGEIIVDSAIDKGTTFTILLPRNKVQDMK